MNDLVINLLYLDHDGYQWRLDDLVRNKGFIEPDDFDENKWDNARGGIELITEGHFIFYRSNEFYDLQVPVELLMKSIMLSLDLVLPTLWRKEIEDINFDLKLVQTDGNIFGIENKDSSYLKLRYLNSKGHIEHGRNKFYFQEVVVNKNSWISNAFISINEYFELTKRIDSSFAIAKHHNYIRLYQLWSEIVPHIPDFLK